MKKIAYIISISAVIFLQACEAKFNIGCLKPEGTIETRTLDYDNFTELTFDIPFTATFVEGDDHVITVEAAPNIIDRIEDDSRKSGEDLDIMINGCINELFREDISFHITLPKLEKVEINGDGEAISSGTFTNLEEIQFKISGEGLIDFELGNSDKTVADIDGDGIINLTGSTDEFIAKISGDGKIDGSSYPAKICKIDNSGDGEILADVSEDLKIDAKGDVEIETTGTAIMQEIKVQGKAEIKNFELDAVDTKVEIEGEAEIEVRVSNILEVKIDGEGSVCYKGAPSSVLTDISGQGTVNDCN